MQLSEGTFGETYRVKAVDGTQKIQKFLFSLGCFEGEEITIISKLASNFIVNIKDNRYAIDMKMAKAIELEA